MYAHLNSIDCVDGQTLTAGSKLGSCGNSGNSEGAHLHLELRASLNANDTSWSSMRPNLLDPIVLFRR
jgi:murein DD-endopeptidase MepM/ murein hydrolase activator NlpD